MKRGQISIDLLFAFVLVSITAMWIVGWGVNQASETTTMGNAAKLKVFAVDVRDSVAKVYAAGPGFTLVKAPPFKLNSGDWVNVTLSKNGTLLVTASIGGREYRVLQRVQVPIENNSSVLLTAGNETFRVESKRLPTGGVTVVVTK